MSPLLRDELRIALGPAKVAMVRLGRGLQPEVVARQEISCDAPARDQKPWTKALEGLEAGLSKLKGEKVDAQVMLSNHFVRYALVPWSDEISDQDEEQAFVRLCFVRTYGEDAQHWALRMSPNGYGETQVACAIDQDLLDGLERVAATHNVRLVSLQPYFMKMFNQWQRDLPDSVAWFVVAEPGRLCVSLLQHGRWHTLRTMKVGADWQDALQKLLEREFLISDSATERGAVYLYAPGFAGTTGFPDDWYINCDQPRMPCRTPVFVFP